MSQAEVDRLVEEQEDYKYGFVTDVDVESIPVGLSEETVRLISAKKDEPEWLLAWRLKAFRAWQKNSFRHGSASQAAAIFSSHGARARAR